ncbi:MAG: lytic murein transglycosylase [Gammaproteobacteria bacterium]|nr:lytic murein transglycosylase [Gammaproteobacteria bacterium]
MEFSRAALSFFLLLPTAALADDFDRCVSALGERAAESGVSQATLDRTLPEVDEVERVIRADRAQPEFRESFEEYLNRRVTETRVMRGRELLREHYRLLHEVYLRHGVRPEYIVAFWGLETNYGSIFGNLELLDALATLACDPRRSDFFSREFITALQLHDREVFDALDTPSSWAGAIGHTQFLPSTVQRHAVDFDGDGRIDLFNSLPDAFASAARFLKSMGWNDGERWGREVVVPNGFDWTQSGLGRKQSVTEWRRMGLEDAFGRRLPIADMPAELIAPMGHRGPAFLVYDNFHVIMGWNRSIAYAIAVGHLADRIAGMGGLAADATDGSQRLSIKEVRELQERLNARGYASGEPDGVVGRQTREAIQAFQADAGLPADGYPDQRLLAALRDSTAN